MSTELQLSGTQIQYMSALQAPGNNRSAMQHSSQQMPMAVVAADCKMLHLHDKKRAKTSMATAASMLSVYAARPVLPITRVSSDVTSTSNRKKKLNSNQTKPLLHKRVNVSPTRSVEASHVVVRRSLPSNSSTPVSNSTDKKVTKVYLSQKQSSSIKDCGMMMPCAPPATPTPEHLQRYDYVPSLADIKAQRDMRLRLEGINKSDRKLSDKKREDQLHQQKMTFKEKIAEMRKRQRQEIYALNKVMTDQEFKNFEELVKTKGYNE